MAQASCSDVDSKCGFWYLNTAGDFGADSQSAYWTPDSQLANDFIYISQHQQQQQPDALPLPPMMHQQTLIDFPIDEQQLQQQQQQLFVGGLPAAFSSSPLAYLTSNTDVADCSAYLLPPVDIHGSCQPDDNATGANRHLLSATRVAAAMAAATTSASTSSAMLPSLSSSSSPPSSTTSPASKPVGRGRSRGGKTPTKASSTHSAVAADAPKADAILMLKPEGEPKVKTPTMVAKRNARERRRVEAVNLAFAKLRKYIPYEKRNKRLSKVKTLRITIDYIRLLEQVLNELDSGMDIAASSNYQNLLQLATRKEVVVPLPSV